MQLKPFHFCITALFLSLVSACSNLQQSPSANNLCPEPRPEMCTHIYAPVCALHPDGFKTAPSNCSACSDKNVSGYNNGACPDN